MDWRKIKGSINYILNKLSRSPIVFPPRTPREITLRLTPLKRVRRCKIDCFECDGKFPARRKVVSRAARVHLCSAGQFNILIGPVRATYVARPPPHTAARRQLVYIRCCTADLIYLFVESRALSHCLLFNYMFVSMLFI